MRALLALAGLLLLDPGVSSAQEVVGSTVSGTLVSRSATIPTGETSAELFRVPSGATFIMTQACSSSPYAGVISPIPRPIGFPALNLVGSELGIVPLVSCDPFQPGIAFAGGERISCELTAMTSVDVSCLVTGVLQPARPGNGRGPR